MYEFTKRVQTALEYAKKFSIETRAGYIGTEHILYGLCKEGKGIASKILQEQNATVEKIANCIKSIYGNEKGNKLTPELTPRASRVLENSIKEAQKTHCKYIGTEHILSALLLETDSMAVRVLIELEVDPNEIFVELLKISAETEEMKNTLYISKVSTPNLDMYSKDLTLEAREGKIDPVIGRSEEMQRLIEILTRRTKNNPLLLGEAGVGKTAIVEGLALKIIEKDVPEKLINKRLVMLDISSLIAGAKYRGDFEERLNLCLQEAMEAKNIVIFIDEMHTLIGAGAAEGAIDAANILKPFLARSQVQIIGITTNAEYQRYVAKDSAFARRFQSILVEEPNCEETLEILKGIKVKYETYHNIAISDNVLKVIVNQSIRYITDRNLPDKAIDVLDEACSSARLNVKSAKKETDKIRLIMQNGNEEEKISLTTEDVCKVISRWTKIPVNKLKSKESARYKNIEKNLKSKIIGQDEAIEKISRAIIRSRVGLKDPKRPIGSFLFVGPTGVGKTELVKALTEEIFARPDALIRLDMSEFAEAHSIAKLIGSPPGYVGYGETAVLVDSVRKKPYSIILFDEIEKAHPDIYNILLQILDDGRLTDSQGKTANFKNTICIMTSNIGAKNITDSNSIGFVSKNDEKEEYTKMKKEVLKEVNNRFTPEFLNRLDDIIVFNKLSKININHITELLLDEVRLRAKLQGIKVSFAPSIVEYISDVGFDEKKGARPIRRAIEKNIEDKFAQFVLDKKINCKNEFVVSYSQNDQEVVISKK